MTKKHFIEIANTIKIIKNVNTRQLMANKFADTCASLNPKFKRSVFFSACNVKETKKD